MNQIQLEGTIPMKHLFIVNPVAGGRDRTDDVTAAAQAVLGPAGLEFEVYRTKAPNCSRT